MKEKWKDIDGYEGFYQVSDLGNVRSLDRICENSLGYKRKLKGKLISGYIDEDGYKRVLLYPKSKNWKNRKKYFVHSLVLKTFRGKRPKKMVSRHLDGNPNRNVLNNLKYGTPKQNCDDRKKHGRNYRNKGHNNTCSSLSKEDVEYIKSHRFHTQQFLADKIGCSRITIYRVLKGKRYA